ncbi:hypothetical protein TrVFT333_000905 [Trichoderma virens FT-333]|nr:hypothetical protein TrVFT333_000905 [Trichoderma virens FT-333]
MDLADLLPRSDEDKFLQLPYAERLSKLKPTIVRLYMGNYGPGGKRTTMRQVTQLMRDKFSFYMSQNQLEHTLRKWNVRRRILNREKDDVIVAIETSARIGTKISVSDITLQEGKYVDKKQLKRYLQAEIRHPVVEPIIPGM